MEDLQNQHQSTFCSLGKKVDPVGGEGRRWAERLWGESERGESERGESERAREESEGGESERGEEKRREEEEEIEEFFFFAYSTAANEGGLAWPMNKSTLRVCGINIISLRVIHTNAMVTNYNCFLYILLIVRLTNTTQISFTLDEGNKKIEMNRRAAKKEASLLTLSTKKESHSSWKSPSRSAFFARKTSCSRSLLCNLEETYSHCYCEVLNYCTT